MGKIYETQSSLRIKLTYTADVADDISSVKIKYKKPDGTEGYWNATHVPASKYIYYDFPAGTTLTDIGDWNFWIYATMTDTRIMIGEVYTEEIYEEGIE